MVLIKDLGTRLINGKWIRYGIFWCDGCKQEVEKRLDHGLRDKSCGCQQHSQEAGQKISKTICSFPLTIGWWEPGQSGMYSTALGYIGRGDTSSSRRMIRI